MKNTIYKMLAFSTFLLSISCSKKNMNDINQSNTSNKNPLELISKLGDSESDYSIKISTSLGHSLSGTNSISKAAVFIEATNINEINLGDLSVNSMPIPFISHSYFYQLDSTQNPLDFTGKTNNYKLTGVGFPNFDINNYSATITDISISGLDSNKLQRNSNITINWTPDQSLPSTAECAVYVSGQDSNGNFITFYKPVTDNTGNYTISGADLSVFSDLERIRIFYAKGFSKLYQISGKNIEIGSIGFTYCTVFFK